MRATAQGSAPPARRKPTPHFTWEDAATAALPVLACFLGGATEKWAEGIVLVLLGLLLMLNPPRFTLGPAFHAVLIGLLICSAIAFLPADWFYQPAWRQALGQDFAIRLPSTLSPQPWITTGCLLSFVAGLCWLYCVAGQEVEIRSARRQLRLFALGVVLLAALAITLYMFKTPLPFWHNERGFGFFPNRNQSANLLGLASIMVVACGHDEIRRGKKAWLFWLAGLAILATAIVLNFSRAGILLLVLGAALWLGVLMLRSASSARIAIGASVLLALMAGLLVFGGKTLERFNLRGDGAGFSTDFRWLIFQDAIELIRASPWAGVGLGNFQPVFAIFRDASVGQARALHPESDWLWLCAELGWPGVLLILLGAAILVRRVFPFVEGSNQWFRLAALIAALLFALHGLVDVAGHRVGTAYAGIFLFGLALRRPMPAPASRWLTRSFRIIGLLLFFVGMTWSVAAYRAIPLPGGMGADLEKKLAAAANVGRLSNETIARTTRALEWAPLDWQLYFLRALGRLGAKGSPAEALEDFRRARFLEPNSFEVPYQEGLAWIQTQPALAVTAWREALRRAGPQRPELYGRMLSVSSQFSQVAGKMLEELASSHTDLTLAFLERATGESFVSSLRTLLARDPELQTLTREERTKVFEFWNERGDRAALVEFANQNPAHLSLAWRGVAEFHAGRQDFRRAWELATRFGPRPKLPEVSPGASIEQLQRNLLSNPNDYQAALALYQQQKQRASNDALITVRRLTEQPGSPAYFHFLEAEAWAEQENWERAWAAWRAYESTTR